MHTPLAAKHIERAAIARRAAPVKALEQGIFQICQPDRQQCFVINCRLLRVLKHNGRKLFMVANQNKLINGVTAGFVASTKNTQ